MEWNFRVIDNPSYKECDQLLKMSQRAFGVEAESIYFFRIFVDYGKIFATFNHDEPICVIQAIKNWNDIGNIQLVSCATHPNYQEKGVATFTHRKMLQQLKKEGARSIGVRVPPLHEAVIKILQEKLGFSVIKKLSNYYGMGEDRLYLEKIL